MIRRTSIGRCAAAGIFVGALFVFGARQPSAHAGSADATHAGHEGMDMSAPMHDASANHELQQAILLDKKESEFNHHLAGLLVVLAGLFLVAEAAFATASLGPALHGLPVFWFAVCSCSSSATQNCGPSVPRAGGMASRTIWKIYSTRCLPWCY